MEKDDMIDPSQFAECGDLTWLALISFDEYDNLEMTSPNMLGQVWLVENDWL
jgi:hypothetical protein